MRVSFLRKYYPLLSSTKKNKKWRQITNYELFNAIQEKQKLCNCFSVATKYSLYYSTVGKEILRSRIFVDRNNNSLEPSYKIILSPNGKDEIYRINESEYSGKYFRLFTKYNEHPPFSGFYLDSLCRNLNTAIDIAITKMIKKHPNQKDWYTRLYGFTNKKCEFNKPSRAFEWFTGIKPIQYGEEGYKSNLIKYKNDVVNLLKKMSVVSKENYSFVLVSGAKKTSKVYKWHCMPIIKVNFRNKTVRFYDPRERKTFEESFYSIIEKYKAIVGIFWDE